jgi:hypothetical protein
MLANNTKLARDLGVESLELFDFLLHARAGISFFLKLLFESLNVSLSNGRVLVCPTKTCYFQFELTGKRNPIGIQQFRHQG